MYKVVILLLLVSAIVTGDASSLLSEPGKLIDVFPFENGSALVVTLYSNDLILTYLNAENTILGTTAMFVPFNYDGIVVKVCGGYAQMLVNEPWDGEPRTRRQVWPLPEQIQEAYLPALCK